MHNKKELQISKRKKLYKNFEEARSPPYRMFLIMYGLLYETTKL